MAQNAPLQGTAADIIKIAIVQIDEMFNKRGLQEKVHLILQVHDELVYEVEQGVQEEAKEIIMKTMISVLDRTPITLNISPVPIVTSVSTGARLDELK